MEMILDIILGVVIVGCIIYSFVKGTVRGAFTLGGLFLGIIAGTKFYKPLASLLHLSPRIANPIAFIIIFIVVAIGISIIGRISGKLLQFLGIGFIDHILGGLLGFITGTIISGLVCLLLTLSPAGERVVNQSKIAPIVFKELSWVRGLFPKSLQNKLRWHTPRQET